MSQWVFPYYFTIDVKKPIQWRVRSDLKGWEADRNDP